MRDGEWRLDHPGASLTFGSPESGIVFLSAPEFGDTDLQTEDTTRPNIDGVALGIDTRGGRTVTLDMAVIGNDEPTVRGVAGALRRAWRGDEIRSLPGEVASLTTMYAGRERVFYGRPRRFARVDADVAQGVILVTADFACVDDLFYSSAETSVTVGVVPPTSGGLVAPLIAPLTTVPPTATPEGITITGDGGAWPVITIHGPITNPAVAVTGLWSIGLSTALAFDESVTVDTRPWRRRITRDSDGASLAGTLTRSSVRLARAAIPPGTYEVTLRGIDATGTASMRFAWRDTYTDL